MTYSGLSLENKVAVVVGGTSGIGRALSLGLSAAGASVVASSRRAEQVEAIARELEEAGRKHCESPPTSLRASLSRRSATRP